MKKKNRVLSFVVAILLIVSMLPVSTLTSNAAEQLTVGSKFCIEGLWYECEEVINGGRISYLIKVAAPEDNTVYSGAYRIPSAFPYNGAHCIVTGIAADAFAGSDVSSVHMEQTWRYYTIEHDAFLNCSRLTEVTFGKSFTNNEVEASIDDNAFSGCTALEQIIIPTSIKNIGMFVFNNCTGLKTVVYEYPYVSNRRVSEYAYEGANPTVITQYLMPNNPRWEGTTAVWDALGTSYVRYEVQFSGTAAGGMEFLTKSFYTTGTSMELSEYSGAPGTYSFTVKAIEPEIVFANLKVNDSIAAQSSKLTVGGIEISDVSAVRTGSGTVEVTFNSTSDGSMYYLATQLESINGPNTNGTGIACSKGSNKITLTEISDEPLYLEIRLKNSNGMSSELVRLSLPEFSAPSLQVGMVTLYDGEYTTDGATKTAGTPTGEGYAYFKDGVLTLNNFSYTSGGNNKAAIYATNDLTINAVGTNTIDSTEEYAICLKGGNLTIEGDVLNLAVSNAEKAIATLTLYNDFDGTYGKLNITDVTLNIENKSDDQSYGIRCRDVLIDGSTLTVNMKKEKQHRSTGLDANGTVAIVRNSQVVIDLSEATTGSALIADGSVSVSDSYVELRGDANDGTGLSFNTSYRTLDFNGGTLIIAGARDPGGAIYMYSATIELPDGDYWWRTDENGSYSKGDYTYNKNQTYIEITTSKLQNEWVSTPTIRGWIYNTVKSTPQAEAKYGTVEFKYYDADKNLLTELPDNAGTYYLKGFVAETDDYTGLESDYFWFAVEKDEQYPPRPTGVNTTYIDTNDGKITGVDETMEYRKEGETAYTAVTGTEITGLAPGKYYVRYAESANYNPSPDNVITISLGGKRIIAIAENPTSSRVIIGGKLSDSVLTGGIARDADAVWIPGTYTWKDGTEVLDTKGIFQKTVIFTPDNNAYETVEFDVEVTVIICDTSSGEHEFTVPQKDTADHWNKCSGCDAIDTKIKHSGDDDGDCTTEVKCSCGHTITEARSAHSYEWVIDKEPTASEEGTKHEECTVCKTKRNENTSIPKTEPPFTNDRSDMLLWILVLCVSGTGLAAVVLFGRSRKRQ